MDLTQRSACTHDQLQRVPPRQVPIDLAHNEDSELRPLGRLERRRNSLLSELNTNELEAGFAIRFGDVTAAVTDTVYGDYPGSDDRTKSKEKCSGCETSCDGGTLQLEAVMAVEAPVFLDFAVTPDLDLGFSFDACAVVNSSETQTSRVVVAPTDAEEASFEESTVAAIAVGPDGARPQSAAYSVTTGSSSCDTLDTLGTFGFPDRRTRRGDTSVYSHQGSDANWGDAGARTSRGSLGTVCERRCSDVPDDIDSQFDVGDRAKVDQVNSTPNTITTSRCSTSIGVADEQRPSADSGTTCINDDDTVPAGVDKTAEVVDAPALDCDKDCTITVELAVIGTDEDLESPLSIPTLSTPRFALPTPIGSTYIDEDEAVALLTPVDDAFPPGTPRNINRRLVRSGVKRHSRPGTPDSRRQEQRQSPLRTSWSVSDLRPDTFQTVTKQRPVTTIAARNWRFKRESIQKSLTLAPKPCLGNNIWLRDTIVDICIDQENFRPVHPLFSLVWVSQKTSEEQDRALQNMGVSAEKRILLGGMAEFKPVHRRSYIFHYTTLDASPCLRRVTRHDDESHEFVSRYASLRVHHFGVYSISGVEERKVVTPLKGPHTVQMKWKFEYFVHPKRVKQKDGKIKVNVKSGERMLRPLSFSCTPALVEHANGKKVTLLSVMRKTLMPKLTSERTALPMPRMPLLPPLPPVPIVQGGAALLSNPTEPSGAYAQPYKNCSKSFGKRASAKIAELCAAEHPQQYAQCPPPGRTSRHRRTSSAKIVQCTTSPKSTFSPKHNRSRSASYTHHQRDQTPFLARNHTVSENQTRMARPIVPRELLNQMMDSDGADMSGLPAPPVRSPTKP